jgi:hypothetical protein
VSGQASGETREGGHKIKQNKDLFIIMGLAETHFGEVK